MTDEKLTQIRLTLTNGRTVQKSLPGVPKDDVVTILKRMEAGDGSLHLTPDNGVFTIIYPTRCAAIDVYEVAVETTGEQQ